MTKRRIDIGTFAAEAGSIMGRVADGEYAAGITVAGVERAVICSATDYAALCLDREVLFNMLELDAERRANEREALQ